jgi:SAM-dependent methyltransferase
MYTHSSRLYDKLYHFKDYDLHARKLLEAMQADHPAACSLLEVACGTGRFLEHLGKAYSVEGLDINPELLDMARKRLGDAPLHQGDMLDFDLGKKFDIVACLFSSIAYVRTRERFLETVATLAKHVASGGLLVIEPYFTPETYWVDRITMNVLDEPELKISWMYVSEKIGEMGRLDINYMVGTPFGVRYFTELHELGLFSQEDYRQAFESIGFDFHHDSAGPAGRGLYIARARSAR